MKQYYVRMAYEAIGDQYEVFDDDTPASIARRHAKKYLPDMLKRHDGGATIVVEDCRTGEKHYIDVTVSIDFVVKERK